MLRIITKPLALLTQTVFAGAFYGINAVTEAGLQLVPMLNFNVDIDADTNWFGEDEYL